MRQYRDLFFDLDNTLWDFDASSRRALEAVYENFALQKIFGNFEEFYHSYKILNAKLWDSYRKGEINKQTLSIVRFLHLLQSRTGKMQTSLAEQMSSAYLAEMTRQAALEPGSFEVVRYLYEKGYRLHVISDGFFEVQILKLQVSKLSPFIAQLITAEEVGALKPDKRLFEYALKKANASADTSIVIGDDYQNDILGAKNAGLDQVFYNKHNTDTASLPEKPTFVIRRLRELIDIF